MEESKNTETLVQEFLEYLHKRLNDFLDPQKGLMSYSYDTKTKIGAGKKEQIASGLIFWKFLREEIIKKGVLTKEETRDFLSIFLGDEAPVETSRYITIVAMIESLPTKVWRKILWRENIDALSYESCLRRLNVKQARAIRANYLDLFSLSHKPATPRVFKKSLRDRVKIFFGKISAKKLLQEDYSFSEHQKMKGAYAYNLFGLDFGFGLYPYGENDDTKIADKRITRFLSRKAHVNDFSVNKDDGKYWWLYKKARSNYAINPGKDIKLKTHICPGFWMTLIIHTLFWIVSPIALAITGAAIARWGLSLSTVLPAIFALPMIIWGIVALVRLILEPIKSHKKVVKIIGYCIGIPIAAAVVLAIACIVLIFIGLSIAVLWPIVGPLLSVLFVLTVVFYIFFFITCVAKEDKWFKYDDIPSFVRFILHGIPVAFAIALFDKFLAETVVNLVIQFWNYYISNLLVANWSILMLIFAGIFIYFNVLFVKYEKTFARFEKLFTKIVWGFVIVTMITFGVLIYKLGGFDLAVIGIIPALLVALTIILVGCFVFMIDKVNLENIDEREKAASFSIKILKKGEYIEYSKFIDLILKSNWLKEMDENEKWRVVEKIFYFVDCLEWVLSSHRRISLTKNLITNGSVKIADELMRELEIIKCHQGSSSERLKIIQLMIDGLSIDDAISKVNAERSAYEKFRAKWRKIWNNIAKPLVSIVDFFLMIFEIVWDFFANLKNLKVLFDRMCPFVIDDGPMK
ncbi:MAG: hypothetical protein ACOYMB_04845 [Patescibacteria group bacterium]